MKKILFVLFGAIVMLGLSLTGCEQNPSGEKATTGTETKITQQDIPDVKGMIDNSIEDALSVVSSYGATRSTSSDSRLVLLESFLQKELEPTRTFMRSVGADGEELSEEDDAAIEALLEENPELNEEFERIALELESQIEDLPEIEIEIQDYDKEGNPIGEPFLVQSENGILDIGVDIFSVAEVMQEAQALAESEETKGFAVTHNNGKVKAWPNKKVTYFMDSYLSSSDKTWIRDRLAEITKGTGIRFEERKNSWWTRVRHNWGAKWLRITEGNISAAGQVDRVGYGKATLTMNREYMDKRNTLAWVKGTFNHEIGHILGLKHEHQRPDRNKYVKVVNNPSWSSGSNYVNMGVFPYKRTVGWWFWKRTVTQSTTLGTPFDYQSNMIYYTYDDGSWGVSLLDGRESLGDIYNNTHWKDINGNTYYSPWDIYTLKRMYGIGNNPRPKYTPQPQLY